MCLKAVLLSKIAMYRDDSYSRSRSRSRSVSSRSRSRSRSRSSRSYSRSRSRSRRASALLGCHFLLMDCPSHACSRLVSHVIILSLNIRNNQLRRSIM